LDSYTINVVSFVDGIYFEELRRKNDAQPGKVYACATQELGRVSITLFRNPRPLLKVVVDRGRGPF